MASVLLDRASELAAFYEDVLLNDVVPFWQKNSPDWTHGGYFTCLDRKGKVFDKDKFVWLQGRELFMFSKLACVCKDKVATETIEEWTKIATLGADFLKKHGSGEDGFYFALKQDGSPLVQPYNIFSDCFAVLGFSWYHKLTGDQEAKEITLSAWENVERRKSNPKGKYSKSVSGCREFHTMCLPLIDVNVGTELGLVFPEMKEEFNTRIRTNIKEIIEKNLDPERNLLREASSDNAGDNDTFDGRLSMPGHSLECLWFILVVAEEDNDKDLMEKCCSIILSTLEFGWDKEFGGLYYFMDILGKPCQQLEWNQKLWWVHLEALIACIMAYRLTGREEFANWYDKLHEWSWGRFHDKEFGEWFGYLDRRGDVQLDLKGGKWKGFFHVPRSFLVLHEEFAKLAKSGLPK